MGVWAVPKLVQLDRIPSRFVRPTTKALPPWEPGKSAVVTFVADKEGKFKFRCSIPCGTLHPFMIGELNVEPNSPLARALAATLIVALGAVVWFWRDA